MEEQRKAVRRMQDYINDHISEEISIGDLAKAVIIPVSGNRESSEEETENPVVRKPGVR